MTVLDVVIGARDAAPVEARTESLVTVTVTGGQQRAASTPVDPRWRL
ncbi:hypothetical protein [Paractinoplanes atraurantiacus]|nr:hypothetical protein [Actinoplanes atraurantiacus]